MGLQDLEQLYCTTEAHMDILKSPYIVVVKTLIGRVLTPTTVSDRPLRIALKMLELVVSLDKG